MSQNARSRSRVFTLLCALSAAALVSMAAARPSFGKGCAEGSPVVPVPASLWGELQPAGIISDASNYNGNQLSDSAYPQITAVDIENGFLFASYWSGLQIWDVSGAHAAAPVKKVVVDGWASHNCRTPSGQFPSWPGCGEFDAYIWAVDAPAGNDNLVAVGGENPVGLAIFNSTNKVSPIVTYQDPNHSIHQVYSATINNKAYAFAADYESGIFVYDMTASAGMNKCLDNATHTACPGVYKGKFGGGTTYVHGIQVGAKSIVATSVGGGFGSPKDVELWDVSDPTAPVKLGAGYSGGVASGAALFSQGGQTYLGVRRLTALDIVNVSSCVSSACGTLPAPVATATNLRPVPESNSWKPVIASTSGSTPFLYLGHHDLCHDLSNNDPEPPGKEEYLFDVSNPLAPREVTPPQTIVDLGKTVDYWSWYYSDSVRGFAFTAALGGKFNGPYFYRAGRTIFDIHQWTGALAAPPTANFTWSPSTIYPGDSVTFTDTSSGVVLNRTWTFPGGTPPSASTNPVAVTFATAGTKAVSLQASNSFGTDTKTQNVTVTDPSPAVASVTFTPPSPLVCQPVVFTANGVTGRSPLTVSWSVNSVPTATGSGNPFAWNTVGLTPGTYRGTVTVHNGQGPDATAFADVTLQALGTLAFTGPPTNDPFAAGTVTFHAHATAATEWSWDFGDGAGYRGYTGIYAVPDPVFTYTTTGTKTIKVKIRNCVTAEIESETLTIEITQVAPLVALFQAQCPFGLCGFTTNEAIAFDDLSTGPPDGWFYDWNHTTSSAGTCNPTGNGTVQTAHTYTTAGTYFPCLRVTRGPESQVYVHPQITVNTGGGGGGGGGASLSISGPSTGNVNQALQFTASASNCSPSSLGWSWSAPGGSVNPSGGSATVTWTTTGTKTLTVHNSSCAGATGTKTVSITDGGGGGGGGDTGGLTASFTFSPSGPNAGQAVSFDGSSSAGSPTVYSWNFGDGGTSTSNGATASHTYAVGGSFTATLEVSKTGSTCPFGVCSATTSKVVTVSGGPPPLVASYDTSAECVSDFAGLRCSAETGREVSFTSTTENATSHSWSFGDGGTASGIQASHTWTQPGTYPVVLTVGDGRATASASKTFIVTGEPIGTARSVVLPWIAQTRGALVQSSDLYVFNPGAAAIDVTLTFLKRGTPEANPPTATRTIQPGATLFVEDVLRELFNRENVAGFVTVKVDQGNVEPIITSFNTTFQDDGQEFGQTVPGFSMSSAGSAATTADATTVQSLVGLNDNSERLAYFGISNPSDSTIDYTLRFFDHTGQQIGDPHTFTLGQLGQRQFQLREIRDMFGVEDQDD
jgi:PKD repeat protein